MSARKGDLLFPIFTLAVGLFCIFWSYWQLSEVGWDRPLTPYSSFLLGLSWMGLVLVALAVFMFWLLWRLRRGVSER